MFRSRWPSLAIVVSVLVIILFVVTALTQAQECPPGCSCDNGTCEVNCSVGMAVPTNTPSGGGGGAISSAQG